MAEVRARAVPAVAGAEAKEKVAKEKVAKDAQAVGRKRATRDTTVLGTQ